MAGTVEDLEGTVSVVTIRGWASRDCGEQGRCQSPTFQPLGFSAAEGLSFSIMEGVGATQNRSSVLVRGYTKD